MTLNCGIGPQILGIYIVKYISYKKKAVSTLNGCLPEIENWNSIISRFYCIVSGNVCNSICQSCFTGEMVKIKNAEDSSLPCHPVIPFNCMSYS
jgi:hypothetical protein